MKTLVISDLHLGSRMERDPLRIPEVLGTLCDALVDIDRLILLGDVVELLEGRPETAMELARPVLQQLGRTMGKDREIVVVAGNHDHSLIRPWLRTRRLEAKPVGLATRVAVKSGPRLARLAGWLKPARVRVQYPGVWVADGVYATHGHYLDRHLSAEDGIGQTLFGRVPDVATPDDYERAPGPSMAAVQSLLAARWPGPIGDNIDRAAGLLRATALAAAPGAGSISAGRLLAPLSAGFLGLQFRRAGLPAMGEVTRRLGLDAHHVIFGHLHRLGPRMRDDPAEWSAARADGRTLQLVNTGCWVYEPLLLAGARPPHPYWPGGGVLVEEGLAPRAIGLLDALPAARLRGRPR